MAVTRAELTVASHVVGRFDGGFSEPLPLLLFDCSADLDAEGLGCTARDAAARLAVLGFEPRRGELLAWLLRELQVSGERLFAPEAGWAGATPSVLLRATIVRRPTGFAPDFAVLKMRALADLTGTGEALLGQVLWLLSVAFAVGQVNSSASVHYRLVDVLDEGAKMPDYVQALSAAVPEEKSLREALTTALDALMGALLQRAKPETWSGRACAPAALAQGESGVVWGWASQALVSTPTAVSIPELLTLEPMLTPEHPEWKERVLRFTVPVPIEVCVALVFRSPEVVLAQPEILSGLRAADLLDTLAASVKFLAGEEERWRVRGIALGGELLEREQAKAALVAMRAASDVDHPPAGVIRALRTVLRSTYGLSFDVDERLEDRHFLVPTEGATRDEVRDLARLLFDAIVGSVYEARLQDPEERERFFDLRIAPGLTFLDADPTGQSGRRMLRARRVESGPGLVVVLLFLLGIAAVIVVIGIALRSM